MTTRLASIFVRTFDTFASNVAIPALERTVAREERDTRLKMNALRKPKVLIDEEMARNVSISYSLLDERIVDLIPYLKKRKETYPSMGLDLLLSYVQKAWDRYCSLIDVDYTNAGRYLIGLREREPNSTEDYLATITISTALKTSLWLDVMEISVKMDRYNLREMELFAWYCTGSTSKRFVPYPVNSSDGAHRQLSHTEVLEERRLGERIKQEREEKDRLLHQYDSVLRRKVIEFGEFADRFAPVDDDEVELHMDEKYSSPQNESVRDLRLRIDTVIGIAEKELKSVADEAKDPDAAPFSIAAYDEWKRDIHDTIEQTFASVRKRLDHYASNGADTLSAKRGSAVFHNVWMEISSEFTDEFTDLRAPMRINHMITADERYSQYILAMLRMSYHSNRVRQLTSIRNASIRISELIASDFVNTKLGEFGSKYIDKSVLTTIDNMVAEHTKCIADLSRAISTPSIRTRQYKEAKRQDKIELFKAQILKVKAIIASKGDGTLKDSMEQYLAHVPDASEYETTCTRLANEEAQVRVPLAVLESDGNVSIAGRERVQKHLAAFIKSFKRAAVCTGDIERQQQRAGSNEHDPERNRNRKQLQIRAALKFNLYLDSFKAATTLESRALVDKDKRREFASMIDSYVKQEVNNGGEVVIMSTDANAHAKAIRDFVVASLSATHESSVADCRAVLFMTWRLLAELRCR
jgi:hypothetical protein